MALAVAVLVPSAAARGADTFHGAQYVSGRAGFARKIAGSLVIDDREIRFIDKTGGLAFRIAMVDVVGARQNTQWREYPMTPGTREYLQVETRSGDTTETIVFRTDRHQSAALAAKIEFFREKATAPPR